MPDFDPAQFVGKYAAAPPTGGASGSFDPAAFLAKHGATAAPSLIQEMHPDFTAADRLVTKNFATGNEAAVNYLQKQHPNLEIAVDKDTDQIKARRRDGTEPDWRVLDPKSGFLGTITNPKELALTLGGHAYDLASGVGTTAASALGGLAGAAAGGIGALPAAAGAGAGASAALEAGRQAIGRGLGMEGNFNLPQIGLSGVAGAVAPVLLGTGASAAQIAAKAAESGLDESALAATQRGLIGRGWDAAKGLLTSPLAKLGSAASGASPDAIKTFAANPGAITAMERDPNAITELGNQTKEGLKQAIKDSEAKDWAVYEAALGKAGDTKTIDMQAVAAPLKGAIAQAEQVAQASNNTAASRETVDQLKAQFRKFFTYQEDVPKLDQLGKPLLDEYGQPLTEKVTRELDMYDPKSATKLAQKFAEVAGHGEEGTAGLQGHIAGNTADERQIRLIADEMKSVLDRQVASVIPPEALAAKQSYGTSAELRKQADKLLSSPQQIFQNLRNADKTPNIAKLELFNNLDQRFGTSLIDTAKKLQAYSTFAKPAGTPLSAFGATSTSRSIPLAAAGGTLGYLTGSNLDHGGHGGMIGGGLGAALGGALGSPAALRQYIQMAGKAGALRQAMPNALPPAAAMSAWNMMGGAQ